jgi:hypothetical protein
MPIAKKIRYSKKLARFICEKVAEGLTIAEICDRKYKDICPNSKSIYRWEKKYPGFKEDLTDAYELFFIRKQEELDYISSVDSRTLYPDIEDFKERSEARRVRIDALKFILGKLAPILTKRFQIKTKIKHEGKIDAPQIVLQTYSAPELSEGIVVDHEDDK